MIDTRKRRIVCCTLIVLNLLFIWVNSLLPREVSAAFSKLVGTILEIFFPGPATPAEGEGHGMLRKVAHFAEFCSLGILLSWYTQMVCFGKRKTYFLPIAAGIAVAAVDESIQIFVPGRGPRIRDVGIDSLGVMLGVVLIYLIARHQQHKIHKTQDNSKENENV